MKIGNKNFDTDGHTSVMAILNVTPDSFSDGGKYDGLDDIRYHVENMIKDGAELIDIGGESTRPGYKSIPADEEAERVLPVIECLKKDFDIPLSIDTCKAEVAEAAIKAGADMVNDIWGLMGDGRMAEVIAGSGAACCLMHNRKEAVYEDFLTECMEDMRRIISAALKAGISRDKIILDPGIGFGKTYDQNMLVMAHLADFKKLGFPMLLGASRKSMIGQTLDLPVDERLEGTLVTTIRAVDARYSFVRVHDVRENVRAIRMAQAVRQYEQKE